VSLVGAGSRLRERVAGEFHVGHDPLELGCGTDRRERRLVAEAFGVFEAVGDRFAEHGDRVIHSSSAVVLKHARGELAWQTIDRPQHSGVFQRDFVEEGGVAASRGSRGGLPHP
jgi:hypothetical protein